MEKEEFKKLKTEAFKLLEKAKRIRDEEKRNSKIDEVEEIVKKMKIINKKNFEKSLIELKKANK